MLTKIPEVGDRVLLVDRNDNRRMRDEPKLLPVEKVGSKYLTIKIKKAVSAWGFGDGLSDEDLEQICKLIEVKS